MEYNTEKTSDIATLLQIILPSGEGIGWYLLERVLTRRNHAISKSGKLMTLLKEMESAGLIESRQSSNSVHPVYLMTITGKEWLHKLPKLECDSP
jgi:DNA-binding PadR family transcriptional regulator